MKEIKTLKTFSEHTEDKTKTVLVDFWGPWCKPCKALATILEGIKKDYPKLEILKVNVEEAAALAQSQSVSSLPTLIMFKHGKETNRIVGLIAEAKLRLTIENLVK